MEITELKKKLDEEFLNYYTTVLVSGAWGIGKTWYIKNYLANRNYIYLSLFGVNSIEELKCGLYYELCKNGIKFKKIFNKYISGSSLSFNSISIPIPNISFDIDKKIKKNTINNDLIIVIDDLERKCEKISFEEILGFIESVSQKSKVKIIVIANEEKLQDKEIYVDFKEKVIQKTYIVDKFSANAIKTITYNLVGNSFNFLKKEEFLDIISSILSNHKVKNLRTVQKGILFSKMVLNNLSDVQLSKDNINELIVASFGIVIEKVEELYIREEKDKKQQNKNEEVIFDIYKNINYCILKHYFNDGIFTNYRIGMIDPLLKIYDDKDEKTAYKDLLSYFLLQNTSKKGNKELFYCSEDEIKKRIKHFIDDTIIKKSNDLSLNIWFKEFTDLYDMAEKINKKEMFVDEQICDALNYYSSQVSIDGYLHNSVDRSFHFWIENKNVRNYYDKLNKFIAKHYMNKIINKIIENINDNIFDNELIDKLFSAIDEKKYFLEKDLEEIYNKIRNNNFFIIDLNGEIDEDSWEWCHKIWEKCSMLNVENKLRQILCTLSENIIKNASSICKYRINSLNSQYKIYLENAEKEN